MNQFNTVEQRTCDTKYEKTAVKNTDSTAVLGDFFNLIFAYVPPLSA